MNKDYNKKAMRVVASVILFGMFLIVIAPFVLERFNSKENTTDISPDIVIETIEIVNDLEVNFEEEKEETVENLIVEDQIEVVNTQVRIIKPSQKQKYKYLEDYEIPEVIIPEIVEEKEPEPEYQFIGNMKITGYTHEEGFRYGQTTASGVGCREGICALNYSRLKELGIKYGDQIYIEGLGTYTVYDCGCSYNTVDIWMWTNREAYSITGYRNVYKIIN